MGQIIIYHDIVGKGNSLNHATSHSKSHKSHSVGLHSSRECLITGYYFISIFFETKEFSTDKLILLIKLMHNNINGH